MLLLLPKEIAKKENKSLEEIEELLNKDVMIFILNAVYNEKIHEKDVKHVLEKICSGVPFKEAIKLGKKDFDEVEEKILKIIKEKPNLSHNAYMGLVMKELKGSITGQEAMEIILKLMK
ncbi:MAG: hypothetical protein QJ16_C0005G0107 [archaeon GW2011_AR1]|nr:MAG: hypothetical protein QJ16_C0005G0107 [archaeon GW2011_AR1]